MCPKSITKSHIYILLISFLYLGNFKVSYGQIPSVNKCLPKSPITSIDIRKLSGLWYEIEASPMLAEWPYKCVSVKVTSFFERKAEITVEAVNRFTNKSQVLQTVNAVIPLTSNGNEGQLVITPSQLFSVSKYNFAYENLTIQLLATDHANWIVVRLCKDYERANAHTELVWILAKQRELSNEHYKSVREAVVKLDLEGIPTKDTIQYGCTQEERGSGHADFSSNSKARNNY